MDEWTMATEKDAEGLLAMYRYAAREGAKDGTTHWDEYYPNAETIAFDLEHEGLFVLREGEAPVAAVSLVTHDDLDELDCWHLEESCALARLCVAPAYQRRGLGAAAVRLVMARARERGYRSMRLLAAKSNEVTNRMYAKAGFCRVGETRMYDHDFVCYEADLLAGE